MEKFVGTSFVGVSPEFEMALYTMCFLVGEQENEVSLNTGTDVFGVKIKCYRMDSDKIGTSFPEVSSCFTSMRLLRALKISSDTIGDNMHYRQN